MKQTFLIFGLTLFSLATFAQASRNYVDTTIVQFTGMILADDAGQLVPIPFATVAIKGEGRGTYANYKGFFSLVARKGDKITFSAIGFRPQAFMIPDTIKGSRFSIVQLMSGDTINLPIAVIFPWPDRNNFKQEFLAMDVTTDLAQKAKANVAEKRLAAIRENTVMDGNENADYYLRQQSKSFYHIGQTPPMNIFNPMAWNEFFSAWKSGQFKRSSNKKIKEEDKIKEGSFLGEDGQ
ncbi:MAG: hypothetical protein ACI97N_000842 [Cognaticolwellia sp.]